MNNTDVRIIGKDDLDIETIRAEITSLLVESRRKEDEREKIRAETQKMQAEVLKLNTETKWHPFYKAAVLWGSAFAAAAAVIKFSNVFLK